MRVVSEGSARALRVMAMKFDISQHPGVVLKITSPDGARRVQLDGAPSFDAVSDALGMIWGCHPAAKYADEDGDLCHLVEATFEDFLATGAPGLEEAAETGIRPVLKIQVNTVPPEKAAESSSTSPAGRKGCSLVTLVSVEQREEETEKSEQMQQKADAENEDKEQMQSEQKVTEQEQKRKEPRAAQKKEHVDDVAQRSEVHSKERDPNDDDWETVEEMDIDSEEEEPASDFEGSSRASKSAQACGHDRPEVEARQAAVSKDDHGEPRSTGQELAQSRLGASWMEVSADASPAEGTQVAHPLPPAAQRPQGQAETAQLDRRAEAEKRGAEAPEQLVGRAEPEQVEKGDSSELLEKDQLQPEAEARPEQLEKTEASKLLETAEPAEQLAVGTQQTKPSESLGDAARQPELSQSEGLGLESLMQRLSRLQQLEEEIQKLEPITSPVASPADPQLAASAPPTPPVQAVTPAPAPVAVPAAAAPPEKPMWVPPQPMAPTPAPIWSPPNQKPFTVGPHSYPAVPTAGKPMTVGPYPQTQAMPMTAAPPMTVMEPPPMLPRTQDFGHVPPMMPKPMTVCSPGPLYTS